MANAKPYVLTDSSQPSLRRAAPAYQQPNERQASAVVQWAPLLEQGQAPLTGPVGAQPARAKVALPFRVG